MSVVAVEFGKARRDFKRRIDRLQKVADAWRADFDANPMKHYQEAVRHGASLNRVLLAARACLRWPWDPEPAVSQSPIETIVVDRAEWERLKAMEAVIRREIP